MGLNTSSKYSDEEIESVRDGEDARKISQQRRDMRGERPDSPLRQKRGPDQHEGEKAELDVLKLLKQVRSSNPYLSQNNLLESRISQLEETVNPKEQAKIKQDISNILSTTYAHVIQDKSREIYFRNHAQEWSQQMKSMDIKQQVEWIEGIDKETAKRKAPFDALKHSLDNIQGISSGQKEALYKDFSEYMANHSRHENEQYSQNFQKNVDEFNGLIGKLPNLSKAEKEKRTKDFLNVSSNQQVSELKKLRELTETKPLEDKFKQFSEDRQKKHPDFASLDRKSKERVLRELTKELTTDYRNTYQGAEHQLTKADIQAFEQTVKQGDIAFIELCYKDMPRVVNDAKDTFSKGEELMKKFTAAIGKDDAKRLFDSMGWYGSQISSFERKKIIQSKALEKIFKGNELAQREKNIKTFDQNLEGAYADKKKGHGHSLMHKKGRESNKAWFKRLSTKDQKKYLKGSDIEKSLKKRQKINKEHSTLPDGVKKEMFNAFENMGMEERESLNKKITWQREENATKYSKQLEKASKDDLISKDPKVQQTLLEEFDNLSLQEQGKRKEKDPAICNPELEAAVKVFKESFARPGVDSDEFQKAWQEFKELAQPHERISFVKQFLVQHDQTGNEELNEKLADLADVDSEDIENANFREKLADKAADSAEEALEEGNTQEAAEIYKEATDIDPSRDDLRIIAEVMEESAYKDAPIPPAVQEQSEEAFDALMNSEDLQDTLKDLSLAQEALESLSQSERSHQNLADAESKSMDVLKKTEGQDVVDLQKAVTEYEEEHGTKDKTVITNDNGKLQGEQVVKVKLDMNNNDISSDESNSRAKRKSVVKELKENQGKNKGMETFEVTDDQGRTQKTSEAETKHNQMKETQMQAIIEALVLNLTANKVPRPIAEKAAMQIVAHRFDKELNKFSLNELEE